MIVREMLESDLPTLFEQQRDPEANYMAAFTSRDPSDRDAFMKHWRRVLADPTLIKKTIVSDTGIVGSLGVFLWRDKPQVTYWIAKEHWGKGIATAALSEFLRVFQTRPLYASAARDNIGSIRVLEKCGFQIQGYERSFAQARGAEIEEVMLQLG
nr:GNAT family N-acetyltransferase [uncultured bacterium]